MPAKKECLQNNRSKIHCLQRVNNINFICSEESYWKKSRNEKWVMILTWIIGIWLVIVNDNLQICVYCKLLLRVVNYFYISCCIVVNTFNTCQDSCYTKWSNSAVSSTISSLPIPMSCVSFWHHFFCPPVWEGDIFLEMINISLAKTTVSSEFLQRSIKSFSCCCWWCSHC